MAHVGILFCLYDHLKQLKEENIMAYMSEEGYKKLMAELKELETVERPKISAAIAEARDKGDLSENAEYDAAKEAQGMLEMRINKLKTVIADAKIIDESKLKTDSVQIQLCHAFFCDLIISAVSTCKSLIVCLQTFILLQSPQHRIQCGLRYIDGLSHVLGDLIAVSPVLFLGYYS